MKIFIVNIPKQEYVSFYPLCCEILMDYFKKHNLDVYFLDKNDFGVDPSWLKLRCFDYVDDDFVLCWDMDLLPRKNSPSIVNYLNFSKINMVEDWTFYTDIIKAPKYPFFKFNGGLIGIPKSYKQTMEKVFLEAKTSTFESYEQYPLNRELYKNNFNDVHELDHSWNSIFRIESISSLKVVHYPMVFDPLTRHKLVVFHHKVYFS